MRHTEDWEVVKEGKWFYAGEVICDLRILKHGWYFGSGDYENEESIRENREGEFYYVEYGSITKSTKYEAGGSCFNSLEEAMKSVQSATHNTVTWSA
jgi:hypothetical protein